MSEITPHTEFINSQSDYQVDSQEDFQAQFKEAYLHSIKLLTKQDYSVFKVRTKLLKKSFDESVIDSVIDKLIESKYLREDFYAQARIKASMQKGYSKDYIQQKLASENVFVDCDFIQAVFSEYQVTEYSQIEQLVEKKLRSHSPKDLVDFNFRKKLLRYLMSKGHSLDQSSQAVESYMRSNDDRSQFV